MALFLAARLFESFKLEWTHQEIAMNLSKKHHKEGEREKERRGKKIEEKNDLTTSIHSFPSF